MEASATHFLQPYNLKGLLKCQQNERFGDLCLCLRAEQLGADGCGGKNRKKSTYKRKGRELK